jgi:squalene-hopene/tetraprenyl-beta-curcumene cyclase
MLSPDRLRQAYHKARQDLLDERVAAGHWVGELSSSALSTATAVSALAIVRRQTPDTAARTRLAPLVDQGLQYLARSQNGDGGWGDTDISHSNIATTMLAQAAFHLAGAAASHAAILARAEHYLQAQGGIAGLRRRYGKDKTFAVPILTNAALAGLVPWRDVAPLPFEMACLPHWLLGLVRLPVVSYAIPALVAIGQARHHHRKPWNPIARLLRRLSLAKSLAVVQRMQPESGGFLEATPLTSFVVMSLAGIGHVEHPVVRRGVEFLVASVRSDGSWPIDTNLATWGTTLAVNALAAGGQSVSGLNCLDWLLGCQHQRVHPFTSAAPGGWGWTDLSGAVPDGDDTPGALLALATLRKEAKPADIERIDRAAAAGITWLMGLQNADGGWPTFCRGWGALPFDRSGVDLTAHALRALHAWRQGSEQAAGRIDKRIECGLTYLAKQQRADGRWVPLWFGNQDEAEEENPVYGTARVLLAYRDLGQLESTPAQRGLAWLAAHQRPDGGWGGSPDGSSVEETAVAVEALLAGGLTSARSAPIEAGVRWLVEAVETGRYREPAPIGLYFAKLWYYERLYPRIFTVAALGQAVDQWSP